jgi:hypothetical protein
LYSTTPAKTGAEILEGAQFFEIDSSVYDAAHEASQQFVPGLIAEDQPPVFPEGSRLPAEEVAIWFPKMGSEMLGLMFTAEDPMGKVQGTGVLCFLMTPSTDMIELGWYKPGVREARVSNKDYAGLDRAANRGAMLLVMACLMDLINQPDFVLKKPLAETRQQRRAMQRQGQTAGSWHKIEWDLSKPRMRKGEREGAGWHMPLHYTRGYWRRGQAHWDGVARMKDGNYYKWVEGYWSGHPAYGIKRAVYAPRIGEKTA